MRARFGWVASVWVPQRVGLGESESGVAIAGCFMTSGWTNSRVSALIICFRCLLSPEHTNYTSYVHGYFPLCAKWINVSAMHRARHGAWCMEGRLELWAVVLHGRLDDFIGLTHRGGSEHRSQRGMCVNSVHGTFAACAVQNSEVIVHHSRGGRMSVRCVHPVTAIVG